MRIFVDAMGGDLAPQAPVEGTVEATMNSRVIKIAENGAFHGTAEIDIAEIHGEFDGTLTVRQKLVIFGSGKVSGKIRYGKVVIEEGGELTGQIEAGILRLAGRDTRRIDPAHLARADADGGHVARIDDGVGFHMLGHGPGKQQILQLFGRRLTLGHHLQIGAADMPVVTSLNQKPAGDLAKGKTGRRRIGQPAGGQQAQVLFRGKDLARLVAGLGGDDDLGKDLGDGAGGFSVKRRVQRDNAAECRGAVAVIGAPVSLDG